MKYILKIISVLLSIGLSLTLYAQKVQKIKNSDDYENAKYDLEQCFENRSFDIIIQVLGKKELDENLSMRDYYLLARAYAGIEKYSNGYTLSVQMMKKCKVNKDTVNYLVAYNLLVENLTDMGKVQEAISYCENAESLFRIQDSLAFQRLCFKCGVIYYYNKEHKKAYEIYNKITKKEYRELPVYIGNYGLILTGLEKWEEAIENYKQSITTNRKINDIDDLNITFSNIALNYIKLQKWNLAKKYLDSARFSFTEKSQIRGYKTLNENYFLLYKYQGKLDTAAEYLQRVHDWNEEIFRQKINEKMYSLENSTTREKNLKKKVKTIDDELITSQKQKLWGAVILLLIILVLLSLVFFFAYNRMKVAHENVLIEQKLLRSQITPHFMFNSLSILQGMILNNESKVSVRYLSKFSKLLRIILENSREKLVPIQKELEALQNYVDLQNMGETHSFEYILKNNLEDHKLLVPPMLIQPFVENAIIHGFKEPIQNPLIKIELSFQENKLMCIIKDNGIGIDHTASKIQNNKQSLATKITSERLSILSKKFKTPSSLQVENRKIYNEKGTQVTLILPYILEK